MGYKLTEFDFVHKRYIDEIDEWQVFNSDDSELNFNFVYVDKYKCCFPSFHEELNHINRVNLKSSNNVLRRYDFPIHHHLPKAMLKHEEKTSDDNLYFGLELEVGYTQNCPRNKIHKLIEEDYLKGIAICKRDGSVNNGFEINTVPMTFDYIKATDLFFEFYKKTNTHLRSYKMSNTGIHVHISRKNISVLDQGKILEFVNSRINRDYIIALSGRNPNTYCELNNRLKMKSILFDKNAIKNKTDGRLFKQPQTDDEYFQHDKISDKYQAVNMRHPHTIEFRIFKGNTKPQAISRYIEFCHALRFFVKETSNDSINFNSFIDYVFNHKSTYPFLNEFNQKFKMNNPSSSSTLKETFTYKPRIDKIFKNKIEIPTVEIFSGSKLKIKKTRKIVKR